MHVIHYINLNQFNWRTSTFLHIFMFKTKPWLKTPLRSTVDPIEAPKFLIALQRLQLMPLVRLQRDCVPGGKSEWTSRSYVHGHKERRRPQGPITGLEQVSVDAGTRRLMRTDVSLPVWPTLCLYVRKEKKKKLFSSQPPRPPPPHLFLMTANNSPRDHSLAWCIKSPLEMCCWSATAGWQRWSGCDV